MQRIPGFQQSSVHELPLFPSAYLVRPIASASESETYPSSVLCPDGRILQALKTAAQRRGRNAAFAEVRGFQPCILRLVRLEDWTIVQSVTS